MIMKNILIVFVHTPPVCYFHYLFYQYLLYMLSSINICTKQIPENEIHLSGSYLNFSDIH
jgi:hypothetical protein